MFLLQVLTSMSLELVTLAVDRPEQHSQCNLDPEAIVLCLDDMLEANAFGQIRRWDHAKGMA